MSGAGLGLISNHKRIEDYNWYEADSINVIKEIYEAEYEQPHKMQNDNLTCSLIPTWQH